MRRLCRAPAALAALVALAVLVGACADDADPSADTTLIATTGIWADVVDNLACETARVETLIPTGADPHGFEPSLAARGRLEAAALVVANGLGLEEQLDDTLDAVADSGTPVVRLTDLLPPDLDDPHVWFDPSLVAGALPALADRLVDDAGLPADEVARCLADYQLALSDLDAELAETLAVVPAERRRLVTNHDSLGYFADRYGFEVIGVVLPDISAITATNPAALEELARAIEQAGVPAIFAEEQHSTDDADALARRVGDVEVVTLWSGSLGGPGTGAETYAGLLRTDARLIAEALS